MSTFYVGQRVKIVYLRKDAVIFSNPGIGAEGVINQIGAKNERHVSVDYGVTINGDSGWCFYADELEPILPEGWKVTDWDKCLWQPEGEIA